MREKKPLKNNDGFTILEVIISLSLVSIIAIFAVYQVGQSQSQLGQTKWRDNIDGEARMVLIDILSNHSENMHQQGTLKPQFPHIEYVSRVENLHDGAFRKLTITFTDNSGKREKRNFQLEYYLP